MVSITTAILAPALKIEAGVLQDLEWLSAVDGRDDGDAQGQLERADERRLRSDRERRGMLHVVGRRLGSWARWTSAGELRSQGALLCLLEADTR